MPTPDDELSFENSTVQDNGIVYLDDDNIPEAQEDIQDDDNQGGQTINKDEYEDLKRKADINTALGSVIKTLGSQQAQPVNAGKPLKSEEEWKKEIEEQIMIDPVAGTTAVTQKIIAQSLGGVLKSIKSHAKKLAQSDPIYQKYGEEVEAFITELPAEFQNNPEVYDYAIGQIKIRHFDDIVRDEAAKIANASVVKQQQNQVGTQKDTSHPGGVGYTVPRRKDSVVYLTASEKSFIEQQALIQGVPYYIAEERFIENKKKSVGR